MASDHEIVLWCDHRYAGALEKYFPGELLRRLMQCVYDMTLELPKDVRSGIERAISEEDRVREVQREADRRMAVLSVRTDGEVRYFCFENGGVDTIGVAKLIRTHLTSKAPHNRFVDRLDRTDELTCNRYEQYVSERLTSSPRVIGVYEIDLDKSEFAMMDRSGEWLSCSLKDVSSAYWFATRKTYQTQTERLAKFNARMEECTAVDSERTMQTLGATQTRRPETHTMDELSM